MVIQRGEISPSYKESTSSQQTPWSTVPNTAAVTTTQSEHVVVMTHGDHKYVHWVSFQYKLIA